MKSLSPFFDWEVDYLQFLSERRTDLMDTMMNLFNFTGDVMFFSILLPLIYWMFSKQLGLRLSLIIFSTFYLNVFLKDWFQISRPFQAYSDQITAQFEQSGYSTPSGHAQQSFTFWGYLVVACRRKWMVVFALIMVLCVGTARMYGGVHYPSDILLGWITALVILVCAHLIIQALSKIEWKSVTLIIIAILVPAVLIPMYHLITGGGLDQDGAYEASGLITFAILGYTWERAKIRFVIPKQWSKRIIAFVIGLIGLLLLKEGLKLILPDNSWSDFIRYGMLSLWTIALAPWAFIKLKLYTS